MDGNNDNKPGRTLIDLVVERPWTALIFLIVFFFAIYLGIVLIKKLNLGIETTFIKIHPLEQPPNQSTSIPDTVENGKKIEKKARSENKIERSKDETSNVVNQPPIKPPVNKEEKTIEGSLNFQTPPSSDYYFIKVQGKGEYQRVEKSGDFKIFVDPTETVVHIDVFNQAKEKITSKNIDATTSNTIQIIIK